MKYWPYIGFALIISVVALSNLGREANKQTKSALENIQAKVAANIDEEGSLRQIKQVKAVDNPSKQNKPLSLISNRFGGWGPFYFGMPFSKAIQTLEVICFNAEKSWDSYDGTNCGYAYNQSINVRIGHADSLLGFNKKLNHVSIAMEYSANSYTAAFDELEARFGPATAQFGCEEQDAEFNICSSSFGHHSTSADLEIWNWSLDEQRRTIYLLLTSYEDF